MEYSSRLLIGIQNHSLALQQVLCRTATRPFLPRAGGEIHSVLQLVKGRAQERLSYVPYFHLSGEELVLMQLSSTSAEK